MDETDALFDRLAVGAPPKRDRDFGTAADPGDAPFAALAVPALAVTDPAAAAKTALAHRFEWDQLGGALPDQLRDAYGRDLRLERERDRFKGAQESAYGYAARRMLPGASAIFNLNEERDYAAAVKRFQAGAPEEGDYAVIAGHERLQGIEKERSTGESVLAAVAHVPAILVEGAFAGKALHLAGKGVQALRGVKAAAPLAGEATAAAAESSRLAKVGQFAGRVAATTPLMPSMYLAEAGRRAAQNGGSWIDAKNFAPAFGMGMATVAVLGSLQKFVTEGSFLRKVAGKTALGMAEQQAVDASAQALSDAVLEKAWKVETGYGLAGDVFRAVQGKENTAVKHALSQAAVFGIFSALHAGGNREAAVARGAEIPAAVAAEVARMRAAGFDKLADQRAREFGDALQDLGENTQRWGTAGPTKEAATEALRDVPDEFKPVAEKIIDSLPTAEEAAKLLDRIVDRGTLDDVLERTRRGEESDRGRPALEEAIERFRDRPEPDQPEPAPTKPEDPLAGWPDADVVGAAQALAGFKPKAGLKPEAVRKKALKALADANVRPEFLAAFRPKEVVQAETEARKASGNPTPPETAPGSPRIDDAPRPVESPSAPPVRAVDVTQAIADRLGKDRAWVEANADKPLVRAARVELDPDLALRDIGTPDHRLPDARRMGAGHAVEFDVVNMKGVAERLGDAEAAKLTTRMAEAVRAELMAAGASEVRLYKVGGDKLADEFGALAKGIDARGVELALARANLKIAALAEEFGVQDLPHTKAGRIPGTGIRAGAAEFKAGTDPRTAFHKASEASKTDPTLGVAPSPLDRVRAAQARRGDVSRESAFGQPAEPFVPPEPKPAPVDPLDAVLGAAREMDAAGVMPEVARSELRAALNSPKGDKLGARERYVLDELAQGKTLAEVGADPKLLKFTGLRNDGKDRRELVRGIRDKALVKLGLEKGEGAIAEDVAAQNLAAARDADVAIGEMSFAPEEVRAVKRKLTAKERAAAEFDRITAEYERLAEEAKKRGTVIDPARDAALTQRAIELDAILKGRSPPASRQPEEVPGGSRPEAEPSPAPGGAGQARVTGRTQFQEEQYQKRVAKEKAEADAKAALAKEREEKERQRVRKKSAESKSPEDSLRAWVASEAASRTGLRLTDVSRAINRAEDVDQIEAYLRSKGLGLDLLAEQAAENGFITVPRDRHATDVFAEALQKDVKIGEAAQADAEIAFNERQAKEQSEYEAWREEENARRREAGEEEIKPFEVGDEDIPWSGGRAAPPTLGEGGSLVTPARLNAQVAAEFGRVTGAKDYRAEPKVPGGANARADLRQRATTTSKFADQDPFVTLEEAAHHLAWNKGKGIETDVTKLPKPVVKGMVALNAVFGAKYKGRRVIVEGYASWAKLHAAGLAGKLTGDAKAAAEWAEKWTRDNGLMGPIDAVTPLFTQFQRQGATQRAQGYGSSTGRPVEAPRTSGEVATDLGRRFLDDIDNNLYPAERFEAEVKKAGGRVDPEKALSTVMAAARTGNAAGRAATWARDGVPVLLEDGRMQKHGPSVAEIEAGADPAWLVPGPDGSASKAGAYHTARGIVSMRAKGYELRDQARAEMEAAVEARDSATGALREALNKEVARRRKVYGDTLAETEPMINRVSEEQFAVYRKALAEWNADPVFGPWAKSFSEKQTAGFNAMLDFMASIGEKTPADVQRWKSMFPDYTPTERVLGPEEGWNVKVPGKKGEKAPNLSRQASGSGEAIVDPRLVYQQRLLKFAEVFNRNRMFRALYELENQPGAGPFVQAYEREAGTRTEKGLEKSEELRKAGLSGDQIGRALKDMEVADSEVYFRHEPWPEDGRKATIEGMVDGKLTSLRVGDRALYDLVTNQQVDAHQTARLLRAFSQMEVFGTKPVQAQAQAVRLLATGASAAFQAKNVPRDVLTFWRNTTDRSTVAQLPGEYWKMAGRFARQFAGDLGVWTKEKLPGVAKILGVEGKGPNAEREDPLWRAFYDARGDQQKQYAFERDNPEASYNGVKSSPNVGSLVKDALNWLGSPELAPRFLEYKNNIERLTGRTQEQLRAEYDAYYKDLKAGRKAVDPLTEGQKALLLNAAWEVTSPFPRQGTVTREFNKITPFFGPAVAGVSKAIRNWKTNPKGALYALGLVAGLRALHWAMTKDEPWYDQLSANDKFNNFVVRTPWGPRRLPGPRDLDVAFGGTLVTALDMAAGKDPRFRQLLEQSTEAMLPPGVGPAAGDLIKGDVGMAAARAGAAPLGPVGTVGVEMMMNKDWTGKPIVPRREEGKTSGWDQFTDHYGPYALKQLTGGRGELSVSGAGLNLVPRVANFREDVDRMYDRIHELEVARVKATRAGRRFPQEAEWDRLQAAKAQVEKLAAAGRGERKVGTRVLKGEKPEADAKLDIMLRQAEVARRALGRR